MIDCYFSLDTIFLFEVAFFYSKFGSDFYVLFHKQIIDTLWCQFCVVYNGYMLGQVTYLFLQLFWQIQSKIVL